MRNAWIAGLMIATLTGCASMGFTSNSDTLVKTAAFDHDCPKEKVRVVGEQEEGMGAASFKLDVCGKPRRYKRMGTMYMDADKASPIPQG